MARARARRLQQLQSEAAERLKAVEDVHSSLKDYVMPLREGQRSTRSSISSARSSISHSSIDDLNRELVESKVREEAFKKARREALEARLLEAKREKEAAAREEAMQHMLQRYDSKKNLHEHGPRLLASVLHPFGKPLCLDKWNGMYLAIGSHGCLSVYMHTRGDLDDSTPSVRGIARMDADEAAPLLDEALKMDAVQPEVTLIDFVLLLEGEPVAVSDVVGCACSLGGEASSRSYFLSLSDGTALLVSVSFDARVMKQATRPDYFGKLPASATVRLGSGSASVEVPDRIILDVTRRVARIQGGPARGCLPGPGSIIIAYTGKFVRGFDRELRSMWECDMSRALAFDARSTSGGASASGSRRSRRRRRGEAEIAGSDVTAVTLSQKGLMFVGMSSGELIRLEVPKREVVGSFPAQVIERFRPAVFAHRGSSAASASSIFLGSKPGLSSALGSLAEGSADSDDDDDDESSSIASRLGELAGFGGRAGTPRGKLRSGSKSFAVRPRTSAVSRAKRPSALAFKGMTLGELDLGGDGDTIAPLPGDRDSPRKGRKAGRARSLRLGRLKRSSTDIDLEKESQPEAKPALPSPKLNIDPYGTVSIVSLSCVRAGVDVAVVVGCSDGVTHVLRLYTGSVTGEVLERRALADTECVCGPQARLVDAWCHKNGAVVVTVDELARLRVYDAVSTAEDVPLIGHSRLEAGSGDLKLSFHRKDKHLAATCGDSFVLWDVAHIFRRLGAGSSSTSITAIIASSRAFRLFKDRKRGSKNRGSALRKASVMARRQSERLSAEHKGAFRKAAAVHAAALARALEEDEAVDEESG